MKRFLLWDYPRASWQYDVMVIAILAFIWLTPPDWLRDPTASGMGLEIFYASILLAAVAIHHSFPDQHFTGFATDQSTPHAFLVADMPFGSYQGSVARGTRNVFKMVQRTGCDCVKIETGDSQLRWIGPEKGAIHLATGAVVSAVARGTAWALGRA